MKKILVLDKKNYTEDMPILEKYTVRAIIIKDGLAAMQKSRRGIYKIPGGGVENDESYEEALIREVREETGLIVDTDTISEIGEVLEIREDYLKKGQKYICHSFYYKCDVFDQKVSLSLTPSEKKQGYKLEWVSLSEVYRKNIKKIKKYYMIRDTEFINLVLSNKIKL